MAYIGTRVQRREDPRLVQGKGQYVEDITLPGMVHAGFVRSPYAHAHIRSVDLSAARSLPGVVAAHAAGDLPELARAAPTRQLLPNLKGHGVYPLARDTVRYVGEPVAVVLAEDPYLLADAVEAVAVEFEPLAPVIEVEAATDGTTLVWEDVPGNVALDMTVGHGDVDAAMQEADVVVEERLSMARAACAAIEPRAVAAAPGGDGEYRLTVWGSTQAPHAMREEIAGFLGLEPQDIRVTTADVGGGFGPKARVYPEDFAVAALALHHQRPVRFVATRTEDSQTTSQGRGQAHYARLAARSDGTILGIEDRVIQDAGAYTNGLLAVMNTVRHVMGPYRVPAVRAHVTGVYTNKVPISPLRGGGRPEGVYVMERLLDRLAERLGLDRAQVRRRNFIPPDVFPYDTSFPSMGGATVVYDSGNFPGYLERALETIGYADFRREQEECRREGRYLGLGLAAFIESTGAGAEGARIAVQEDGTVLVAVGSPSTGQGHATTFAQMAAERMGVPLASVKVVSGDTGAFGWGMGTFASRMGQFGGNAVSLAAREVREKALRIAADMLEISPHDLQLEDGRITVRGLPERSMDLAEIVAEAARRGERLEADGAYRPEIQNTWAGGVNAAVVEVDVETGRVAILRYVVVHDAGTIVNPTIVEGQIQGGVIHGVGNVFYEEAIYGDDGQPLTASFADYMLPGAEDAPSVDIVHVETPSPFNPEGIKGAGEGGTIAAIPTLVSAVEDALSPFHIKINDVPIHAAGIAAAVSGARGRGET